MAIDGFKSFGIFSDTKNFPWGFKKSGDFTIAQAEILEKYGKALRALENKESPPATQEEKQFVAVCNGKAAASSPVELAWLKYRSLTEKKVVASAFGTIKVEPKDELIDFEDDSLDES